MSSEEMLDEIENNGTGLTQWEEDFVSDIRAKFDDDEDFELSTAQQQTLNKIYDDRV